MQSFTVALWKNIACIAIHMGVAMELQMLRPYGAGKVVRGIDLTPAPLLTGEGRCNKETLLQG
ncbi:hypothetical protein [Tenuifilum sp.]|uniref:hypothetical protein n=1 Tax=Tenuifilum sp. TaxID=2760880 RepID=UPI002CA302DA|nr:hypothetical protein [Tenuifilum sp.]HPP91072.1 hypothetical protein [Tenuifilum sp.]